ncbi:MAG: hypothetical protein ACXU9L_06345 [Thermodesulfobacteriota bacterium]
MSKVFIGIMGLLFISLLSGINHSPKENHIVQLAIQTVRGQASLSENVTIKFVEKRESLIPDFYVVKLAVVENNNEFPVVVYVDRTAEKVILGTLFIRGENMTKREEANLGIPKANVGQLEAGKTVSSF